MSAYNNAISLTKSGPIDRTRFDTHSANEKKSRPDPIRLNPTLPGDLTKEIIDALNPCPTLTWISHSS